MRRLLTVGVIGSGLLLASAAPAAANRIEMIHQYDNDTSIVDWCSFPVRFTSVGPYRIVNYYDRDDRLRRTSFVADAGRYRFVVSANGVTLETTGMYKAWFVYDDDGNVVEYRESGEVFAFTAPGRGVVFLLAGHSVLDATTGELTFEAGPRGEDTSALCEALAGS